MEAPAPFNVLLWRSVVDRGDELWVGYRSVFEASDAPVEWVVYPRRIDALDGVADTREVRAVTRATRGWWIARPNKKGAWIGDLRFAETRAWGVKGGFVDTRLALSWLLDLEAKRDRLHQSQPADENRPESFRRMARRIAGDRQGWNENPRLAGIRGSLPEFLPVVE